MEQLTIRKLLNGYKTKQFSPVEITRMYIERIKKYDSKLHSIISLLEDQAVSQAEIIEKKIALGEDFAILQGIPITFKDNIYTKGIVTTNGSAIDQDFIPSTNAAVVTKLNKAGVITIGKANLYEYAFGITSENPFYGDVKNPWNLEVTAGGSSSGSGAAVAANFCLGSIGTDTAGSIRVPSSCCGVVGLKPTYEKVDMSGIMPLSWSLDHAGPIARNVEDLAFLMNALTDLPYEQNCVEDIRGMRIGIPQNYFNENVSEEVNTLFRKAVNQLESLGAILIEIELPFLAGILDVATTIATSEVGYVHHSRRQSSLEMYGKGAGDVFERSDAFTAHQYIHALQKREGLTQQLNKLYEQVDVIVTPTIPDVPPKMNQNHTYFGEEKELVSDCLIRFTSLLNITGHPALSIPCGLSSEDLPIGMQLIAKHHREDLLIRAAYGYEQSALTNFYLKREKSLETLLSC